jgi:hypothetical protein
MSPSRQFTLTSFLLTALVTSVAEPPTSSEKKEPAKKDELRVTEVPAGAQAYFDCMRPQFGANTREKLEKYDQGLFKLVDEVYKQSKFRYVRYDQRKPAAKEGAKKD